MNTRSIPALLLIVAILSSACREAPEGCTDEAISAITVHVFDRESGEYITGDRVCAVARQGSYADSSSGNLGIVGLATEQPGTFQVRVEVPGYEPWSRDSVRVEQGRCHVEGVVLRLQIQKIPEM